jgi:Xaa-Pro dipeptidase
MPTNIYGMPTMIRRFVPAAVVAVLVALLTTATGGAGQSDSRAARIAQLAAELKIGDPWPAIRRERIRTLLPRAMDAAKVDAWILFCRENHNDPLAKFVGGEHAGRLTVMLFFRTPDGVRSVALAPASEAITLRERLPDTEVVATEPAAEMRLFRDAAERIAAAGSRAIAVNKSTLAVADGLTATHHDTLTAALGPLASRLTSSEELVYRWLGVKLPDEIAIMRKAAALTDLLEYEALDLIVPGTTTNGDLARALRARVEGLQLAHAWPDNPGVQSGLDRGRGSDAGRVIIGGDVIDIDFGIRVHDTWATDLQRFAYVLGPGETALPAIIQKAWLAAKASSRKMQAAMRPGVAGWEIDRVQVEWMAAQGSLPHWANTGHAVGYWAHDVGPNIMGYRRGQGPAPGPGRRLLEAGMTFSFDGNYVWPAEDGGQQGTRSITLEEMVVITQGGSEYLSPVQEEMVLIPPAGRRSPH